MRGDHLVRHLHTHYDRINEFMTAERRQETVNRRLPVVGNRVGSETKEQHFALCLVCKKGATHWTHDKPKDFLKTHYKQSPQCFNAEAFETVKPLLCVNADEDTHPPDDASLVLTPIVKVALDAAVAYEAEDEDDDDEDRPTSLNDKVEALIKQYRYAQRLSLKRYEELCKLRNEVDLTREMMRLYRRAAVRYRHGERLRGCKRSIAIARRELAGLRAGAEASSDTGDLSSASDRSD